MSRPAENSPLREMLHDDGGESLEVISNVSYVLE